MGIAGKSTILTLSGYGVVVRPELTVNMLPRKTSMIVTLSSVPQSATGRRGEYPKALELTHVKELGKLTP